MFIELLRDFMGQKAGARLEVSDVDGNAMIAAGTAKAAPGALDDVIAKAMTKGIEGITGALNATVDKALKEFAHAMTLSRKGQRVRLFGENGNGDPKQTFGRFLLCVRGGDRKALDEMGSEFINWEGVAQKADLNTNVGAQGGFAVPTQHYDDIALRVLDMSVVRKYARVIDMSARMVEVPTPNYTTAPSAGNTATLSGLILRWNEEGGDQTQTEPTLKQLELTNYELGGYSELSNSLLADSPALETFLKNLFAEGVAWYEDYAFLRGDGVKKPLGMVTAVTNWSFTQTRSGANAFALADAAKLYSKLLRGMTPADKIFWALHPTVVEKLIAMTGGDNVIFLNNSIQGAPKLQILGHNIEITEKLPALNTPGDVLLANGQHYLIGDRKKYEVAFSEHVNFKSNQTVFRVVSRVGGLPWLRDKITLSDASSTLGSFVTLAGG